MKLNLGCGTSKLPEYINIDIDPEVKPDLVCDFTSKLPYDNSSIEEVVMYHTLEHIQKMKHNLLFSEVYRILIPQGKFILTFPDFRSCAENWIMNLRGQRDFWEATIYGRQSSPSDFHVCICDRELISNQLVRHGFAIEFCGPEPIESFNSIVKAFKDQLFTYEEALRDSLGDTPWKQTTLSSCVAA